MLITQRPYRPIGNRLFTALLLAALAPHGTGAAAQQQAPFESRLEEVFWACDYVATNQGIDATPVAACSHATEHLKNERFGGDFLELLRWWQQNKRAEHRRLAAEFD